MGIQREMMKSHAGYTFRKFRCTGENCDLEVMAIETLDITCSTPGCRGTITPREVVSCRNYVLALLATLEDRQCLENPSLPVRFRAVTPNLRRELAKRNGIDAPASPKAPRGLAHANSQVKSKAQGDSHAA